MSSHEDLDNLLFKKALFYLKFRSRSEKELQVYLTTILRKIKAPQSEFAPKISQTITRLKELKLINDLEFAASFVRFYSKIKPKAKKIIIFKLKEKGISEDLIAKVIAQELNSEDQITLLKRILEKADKKYRDLVLFKRKQKLVNAALTRGFEYSQIIPQVDELIKKK